MIRKVKESLSNFLKTQNTLNFLNSFLNFLEPKTFSTESLLKGFTHDKKTIFLFDSNHNTYKSKTLLLKISTSKDIGI